MLISISHKQDQEVYFSKNVGKQNALDLTFHKSEVDLSYPKKHLGLLLDRLVNFNEYILSKMNKY